MDSHGMGFREQEDQHPGVQKNPALPPMTACDNTTLSPQLLLVSGTRRDCHHQLLLTAVRPAAHAHNTGDSVEMCGQ